jgi:hypothetical protein
MQSILMNERAVEFSAKKSTRNERDRIRLIARPMNTPLQEG